VFTSDNGGERFSDMWPFTGSKGGVYEGSHRVPAIAVWPGVLPEGLSKDERERANLIAARPQEAARLKAAWEKWNAGMLPELAPPGRG
jgi:hypothetical protein